MRLSKQIERVQEMIKSTTESISNYNIDSIIHETSPENFEKPRATVNSQSPTQGRLTNGHSNSQLGKGFSDNTKMSELDAFMCDLVDEIF